MKLFGINKIRLSEDKIIATLFLFFSAEELYRRNFLALENSSQSSQKLATSRTFDSLLNEAIWTLSNDRCKDASSCNFWWQSEYTMFLNPANVLNVKNVDRIKNHVFHQVTSNCHMRHYHDYHLTTSHIAAFNEEVNVINAVYFCDKWDKFPDHFFPAQLLCAEAKESCGLFIEFVTCLANNWVNDNLDASIQGIIATHFVSKFYHLGFNH